LTFSIDFLLKIKEHRVAHKPMKGMISMLTKKHTIFCKINLSQNNITVNDVIRSVNHKFKDLTLNLSSEIIEEIQESLLNEFLGSKWNNIEGNFAPWVCPHCHERSSFNRRGSRKRKLKTSNGTIEFKLLQVTCKSCNKTFSPFSKLLGLNPRVRISTELEEKIVTLALNNSYNKTSEYIKRLTNTTISHTSVRKIILRVSDSINIDSDINKFDTILIDGTKIKSGVKERGSEIHLALAPIKKVIKYGRNYNVKKLVSIGIGSPNGQFKDFLSKYSCDNIIVDGDNSYSKLKKLFSQANYRRCIWHIPRNLSHLLYLNKVPVEDRQSLVSGLAKILKNPDFYKSISEYMYFYRAFDNLKLKDITNYLYKVMEGIYISNLDWVNKEKHTSNSLIEIEMREINRRMNVGCRWVDKYAIKLLKLIEVFKYASHNFDIYFKQNRRPIINLLQVSIQ